MQTRADVVLFVAFVGFFLFVGLIGALALTGLEGRRLCRLKKIDLNPVALTMTSTAIVILLTIIGAALVS